jgi:hypothetical protein
MSNTNFKRINEILRKKSATLSKLVAQANNIKQLQSKLEPHLAPNLYRKVALVRFEQGELVLSLEPGALLTRFRYQLPELHNQLKQDPVFAKVEKIRVIAQATVKPTLAAETADNIPRPTKQLRALRAALKKP